MTSYPKYRQPAKGGILTPEVIEAFKEWTCKPFSPRASIIFPAVVGSLTFILFVIIGLST